jgi:hypothetical protein
LLLKDVILVGSFVFEKQLDLEVLGRLQRCYIPCRKIKEINSKSIGTLHFN